MVEIGDDMGVDDDGTRWVVERVSEAYMATDGRSWGQITLIAARRSARRKIATDSARRGVALGDDRGSLHFSLQCRPHVIADALSHSTSN